MIADHLATEIAQEIERLIGRIKEDLRKLQDAPVKKQPEILSELFRSAHTLKAVFSTGGFDERAEQAHDFERMLDSVRFAYRGSNNDAVIRLEDAVRAFENRKIASGQSRNSARVAKKASYSGRASARTEDALLLDELQMPGDMRSALTEFEDHRLADSVRQGRKVFEISVTLNAKGFDKELAALREQLNADGEVITVLPEPSERKSQVEFRLLYATGQSETWLKKKLAKRTVEVFEINKKPISVPRVENRTLASIFEFLVVAAKRLSESLGKEVEIYQEGTETPLPAALAEKLREPLLHIVRNAIVHGIEEPATRKKSRKPAKGSVVLHAVAKKNLLIIEVTDDGAGIDPKEMMRRAVDLGFLKSNAKLPRAEQLDLIFLSGFSTSEESDLASGRGIGLDVVAKFIERESGSVSIRSRIGKGTSFTIKLPINRSDGR